MNASEVQQLLQSLRVRWPDTRLDLRETHISWVILTEQFAFKIKKPVRYAFLDFSSLARRKVFCEKEVVLNRRFSPETYLGVVPVCKEGVQFFFGEPKGSAMVIEYAIKMKRLPEAEFLPNILAYNQTDANEMRLFGVYLAQLHLGAHVQVPSSPIRQSRLNIGGIRSVLPHLQRTPDLYQQALEALLLTEQFLQRYGSHFHNRAKEGYYRDLHGDLHVENVFLTSPPTLFDCMEYDPNLRNIDVLSELAFICVDLEARGHAAFAEALEAGYLRHFPAINTTEDQGLYLFYKLYRATLLLKVAVLKGVHELLGSTKKQVLKQYGEAVKKSLEDLNLFMHRPSRWNPVNQSDGSITSSRFLC